ncbi:WecB/TagA/CpsF family glycosyltransferase [Psychromonas sp. PT13]|uniref:WecB/TagA/CpsF family glycosyltransferase n=1 Tax=Psychromonas sp. PT13 TaxID=3439547 RepID=UPI003EBA41FE
MTECSNTINSLNNECSLPRFDIKQKYTYLFGIKVHTLSFIQAIDTIDDVIKNKHSLHIGMLNAAKIVNMKRNRELDHDVRSSNMILADGSSVVMASRILRKPLPERVAGIDLMHGILERGSKEGYRVFCLGATQEVLAKTINQISKLYPGVIIAGSQDGYFSESEEKAVAQKIADSHADVLFVAITSPKKEKFMARWNKVMRVPVVHGVGGSFDVVAGKVQRAPLIWQKYGMEWLYRVKQEPTRLWKRYLITNTLFLGMLIKEMFAPEKQD